MKIEHLRFAEVQKDSYLAVNHDNQAVQQLSPEDTLAMIRHVLRDRSDCDQIPVVNEAVLVGEVNQYGHNVFIDVTYARRGWRATYGARLTDGGISNFQCYMD